MDRTMKYMGQCPDDMMPSAEVPIGWQRRIHQGGVVYISPSGSVLACLEQAKSYLLTDGTCKCGLECPLILHKVFNFDPGAVVRQRTAEDVRADADVTKLCIHKRKIIAVATLHKSMESQLPGAAAGGVHGGSLNHHHHHHHHHHHQAIRNEMHNGLSNSVTPDSNSSYKITMSGQQQQQLYQHDLGSPPPQRDPYAAAAAQSRSRLGAAAAARRSPFSGRHGGLLSPPSSTSCSSQHYGDGTPSPRPSDSLRSPSDPSSVLAFHGALSPQGSVVVGHMNGGERFTPLSPPNIMVQHHGSPSSSGAQPPPPCAMMAARSGGVSLSPSPLNQTTKSPGRQRKSPCNFSAAQIADYQQKAQQQHLSQLPPCVIQKKQLTTSEKDPLGILDPIPSKIHHHHHHVQDQIAVAPPPLPSHHLQFNAQPPQVPPPSMNVNVAPPPAIVVPLPSNLPMPTVKPGAVGGHGLRLQHVVNPASSVSPSRPTITSPPVHVAPHGPALARAEDVASHHSHFAQQQHGGCTLAAAAPQVSKLHSRSPRPSVPLHHLKEPAAVHLRGGPGRTLDSMCPPPPGGPGGADGGGVGQSRGASHQQLLGQQQNPSFPASSLLSAAAKAQLVNQNKLTDSSSSAVMPGADGQPGVGLGPPGLMGGGEQQMYMEAGGYGHVSGPARVEGQQQQQSGRAALRDKLMSQQREALLRKRKQPPDETGVDAPFNMSMQHGGSGSGSNPSSSSRYPEPMKRLLQQQGGGLPSSTPMAHLLQSMSHQSAQQNGLSHAGHHHHAHAAARSGKSPFFDESVPPMSTLQQQSSGAPPRPSHHLHPHPHHQLHGRLDVPPAAVSGGGFQDLSNKRNLNPGAPPPPPPLSMDHQFADTMGQMYDPSFGGSVGGAVGGYGGGHNKAMGSSMDNLNPQQRQQQQQQLGPPYSKPFQGGNPPFRERTVLPSVVSNGGYHTFSESGDASCSLSSSLRLHAQEERVLSLVKAGSHHRRQQQQQMSGQGETRGSQPACGSHPDNIASSSMDRLLHNFQVDFPPGTSSSFGRPEEMSHPGFRDGQWEYPAIHGLRNGREVTDASQWAEAAAAGMSRETMPCVTNNNGRDAFTAASASEMPKKLSHSVIHGPLRSYSEESVAAATRPRPRAGRPRKKPERPNNNNNNHNGVSSAPGMPAVRMRSPRRCNPKKQWLKGAAEAEHDPWRQGGGGGGGGDRLLQSPPAVGGPPPPPTDLNGNYAEMLRRRGFLSHQECPPSAPQPPLPPPQFNGLDSNSLFAHVNGGGGGGGRAAPPPHSTNTQSAVPSSTGSGEGRGGGGAVGFAGGDHYGRYNGHLNGQLNGNYNGQCKLNIGAADHNMADGEKAPTEEEKLLQQHQYKARGSQHARELLWAQALSLHSSSWPSKLKDEGQMYLPPPAVSHHHSAQGKVEPERFHKTIKDDLESLHRANRIHQNGGDFNNYLEAAIENAMSELNKLTGNRDGQMDGPKSKRKRIPR